MSPAVYKLYTMLLSDMFVVTKVTRYLIGLPLSYDLVILETDDPVLGAYYIYVDETALPNKYKQFEYKT